MIGHSLSQLITDVPFIVLDFETVTPPGRPPEPLELAAMRLGPGPAVDPNVRLNWLIRPPKEAPLTAFDTRQTGIRPQDIERAPDALTVLHAFDERVQAEMPLLVAHHAHYEAAILQRFAAVCQHLSALPFLDTMALGKYLVPDLANYQLNTLAHHFGLPIPSQRHRALPDVELTVQVFLKLIDLQLGFSPQTTIQRLLQIGGIKRKTPQEAPAQLQLW